MSGVCVDRVAVVTGAGRGLGRAHALELAAQGAAVVVNDPGVAVDGTGATAGPAQDVVAEIEAGGGRAVADTSDISTWAGAERLITTALNTFGRLDVVVNNAGITRDRMLFNLAEDEWNAVIGVHLTGTAAMSRFAASYFRDESKAGRAVNGRIINTTSAAGLYGNAGQLTYSAAKAGILNLTLTSALELARYGVTVNAIAPAARTRMSAGAPGLEQGEGFDRADPANNSPLVAWLASAESSAVTGRVFEVGGGYVGLADGWSHGAHAEIDRRWNADELGAVIPGLVQQSPAPTTCFPIPGLVGTVGTGPAAQAASR
ncbi:SDR family oxidoreductase [Mycolicibacterium sp.]|uniref:SDR family oxidoreductase n=1 Tax=Mycolicibacterium sp. TaxID=2320850 RepID=UPI003D1277E8